MTEKDGVMQNREKRERESARTCERERVREKEAAFASSALKKGSPFLR